MCVRPRASDLLYLNNNKIPEIMCLNHREEWPNMCTKLSLIICTEGLNGLIA